MHNLLWTDLQHVLAVADHASLAAAARALGVNHTTVLRRVRAFEKSVGVKLFHRSPSGYALTAAGEEVAASARAMKETAEAIERKVAGRDLRLTGSVRITTTDTLAVALVPQSLARFTAAHPGIELEMTTTTAMVNLTKRDADIAVRASRTPPPSLVGRRVASIAIAPYASPAYLERVPARRVLEQHTWLGPDDSLAGSTIAKWIAELGVKPVLRADTLTALAYAAEAGLGVSALPCYLGDSLPGLVRVRGPVEEMNTDLWVLTHEDLRNTARIRAVTDHLVLTLGEQRPLIEGRRRT